MAKDKQTVFVTAEGLRNLKKEYKTLLGKKRPQVALRIKAAKELGDISENSEYDAAREEQSFVERRILELKEILRKARLIAEPESDGVVHLGSRVRVQSSEKEQKFTIVGEVEADPKSGRISHLSPLGRALLGKKIGDEVAVKAPGGELRHKILEVD